MDTATVRERLSAQDATFVYAETGQKPLSVGMLAILEDRGASLDRLRAHVAGRLHLVPRLRQKLAFVPLDQGHPVWVDDDGFDIATHVAAAELTGERDEAEARQLMARFMATPLSRSRPLWRMELFAMSGGRVGLVFKIHHCLLDGVGAAHLVSVLFDSSPSPRPPARPGSWEPAPSPGPRELLREAIREQRDRSLALARRVGSWRFDRASIDGLARRARAIAHDVAAQARAMLWPQRRAALRGGVGPYRRFEPAVLSLSEVKAIKDRLGATVNDVVLAMVASGVGRMLRERGVDTDGATVKAAVPVSRRASGKAGALGNRVSMMTVDLPVDDARPAEIAARVAREMADRKGSGQAEGADFWMALADYAPPSMLQAISKVAGHQHLIDVIVTNVPGPQFPLYLMGGKLLEVYPFVPLFGGTSLGVAVVSYDGRLFFGLSGDHDGTPDLRTVATGVRDSYQTLRNPDHVELESRCELPSGHGATRRFREPGPADAHPHVHDR